MLYPQPIRAMRTSLASRTCGSTAALLLGGSMISAPARACPSQAHSLPQPHPSDRLADARQPDSELEFSRTVSPAGNNWYVNTSVITSGQRSGTGALQVTAGSAEYQDVWPRVQPGHTYQLTGYMNVLNFEAVPNAGIGVWRWDSSSNTQINTVSELAAYSSGYQQVAAAGTISNITTSGSTGSGTTTISADRATYLSAGSGH